MKHKRNCSDCGQDLTDKIQIYPLNGTVLCEQCNWRKEALEPETLQKS